MARLGGLVLVAATALALSSGSASAATVFGADMTQQPDWPTSTLSMVNVIAPGGGADNGAPVSGILTSARIKTKGPAGDGVIRILTQVSHLDPGTYELLNSGPEIPVHLTADVTAAGHITEVQTRQPITAAQRLGWYVNDPAGDIKENYVDVSAECAYLSPGSAGGPETTSHNYTTAGCNQNVLLVSGTIEADSDGDGYGDETQDLCPTNASTHGACPAPVTSTPAPKKKCTKKKHRSALAAKKCKKKRH
jgi:hypothetical protein